MRTFVHKPKHSQQKESANSTTLGQALSKQNHDNSILRLQRMIGNQAVLRLFQTKTVTPEAGLTSSAQSALRHNFSQIPVHASTPDNIRPKLKLSVPRDVYEQEADRIADQVSKQDVSEEKQDHKLEIQAIQSPQDVNGNREIEKALESRLNQHKGCGTPLSREVRDHFEPRFMHDFSKVRVHTDNEATQMNRDLGARAFTYGQNIYFPPGQYNPQSTESTKLLAHELTHVVQQSTALVPRLQKFTAELDGSKVFIKPERGDTDSDLDRVLCPNVTNRRIAGRGSM